MQHPPCLQDPDSPETLDVHSRLCRKLRTDSICEKPPLCWVTAAMIECATEVEKWSSEQTNVARTRPQQCYIRTPADVIQKLLPDPAMQARIQFTGGRSRPTTAPALACSGSRCVDFPPSLRPPTLFDWLVALALYLYSFLIYATCSPAMASKSSPVSTHRWLQGT